MANPNGRPAKIKKTIVIGDKFGKWTIVDMNGGKPNHVVCECDCDSHTRKTVKLYSLTSRTSTNCGCQRHITNKSKTQEEKTAIQAKREVTSRSKFGVVSASQIDISRNAEGFGYFSVDKVDLHQSNLNIQNPLKQT